jgi:predicted MFS family arabinose efflux permease
MNHALILRSDDSTALVMNAAAPDRRVILPALGVTQILAWGSSFYLLAVLSPFIAKDTGWRYDLIVAGASVGLLVAGLISPRIGRLIAVKGGRSVLAIGAMLLAGGLLIVGFASNLTWYLSGWAVIGIGMGASLYDAAFSTLGTLYGLESRSAITSLTLFGGFASTVCWPLSAFLAERLGWRGTCLVYAVVELTIALPILLFALPRNVSSLASHTAELARRPVQLRREEYLAFSVVAVVLTIAAAIVSIMGTHLLPILEARGMDVSAAVALGVIVGPSQVGARIIEALLGRYYHPVWTMIASTLLVAAAAWMLALGLPLMGIAIIVYGAGGGIGSVARGTVPLALFGSARYPVLMGRLALPLLVAMGAGPFVGGVVFEKAGADALLALLAGCATLNLALVAALRAFIRLSPER